MSTQPLRARTAFEIIDAAIQLFRQHYATFVMLGALGAVPLWIVLWTSGFLTLAGHIQAGMTQPFPMLHFNFGTFGVMFLVCYLWSFLISCAFVVAASDAYLNGTVDPARAIMVALAHAMPLILALILWTLASGLGALVFIVGMFYVFARYFAILPAVLLENKDGIQAFHRSRDLSKDYKWRIFGTLALAFLMFAIVIGTLQAVVGLLPMPQTARLLLNGVAQLFVQPVVTIVLTLLYYDQRIRKEGFDLEMLAQQLTPVPAAR